MFLEIFSKRVPRKLPIIKSREENDFLLVLPKFTMSQLVVLNITSKEIYNSCDGNNSVLTIINQLIEKYKTVKKESLVEDTILCIRDLELKGLVTTRRHLKKIH